MGSTLGPLIFGNYQEPVDIMLVSLREPWFAGTTGFLRVSSAGFLSSLLRAHHLIQRGRSSPSPCALPSCHASKTPVRPHAHSQRRRLKSPSIGAAIITNSTVSDTSSGPQNDVENHLGLYIIPSLNPANCKPIPRVQMVKVLNSSSASDRAVETATPTYRRPLRCDGSNKCVGLCETDAEVVQKWRSLPKDLLVVQG